MGWGERQRPRKRPREELEAIAQEHVMLQALVREYLTEMENPVPDSSYRMTLRTRLGENVGQPYHGPPRRW